MVNRLGSLTNIQKSKIKFCQQDIKSADHVRNTMLRSLLKKKELNRFRQTLKQTRRFVKNGRSRVYFPEFDPFFSDTFEWWNITESAFFFKNSMMQFYFYQNRVGDPFEHFSIFYMVSDLAIHTQLENTTINLLAITEPFIIMQVRLALGRSFGLNFLAYSFFGQVWPYKSVKLTKKKKFDSVSCLNYFTVREEII